jgi:hypothetical protein
MTIGVVLFILGSCAGSLSAQSAGTAGEGRLYQWSFSPGIHSVPLAAGTFELRLPSAAGGIEPWNVGITVGSKAGFAEAAAGGVLLKRVGRQGLVTVPERSWDLGMDEGPGWAAVKAPPGAGNELIAHLSVPKGTNVRILVGKNEVFRAPVAMDVLLINGEATSRPVPNPGSVLHARIAPIQNSAQPSLRVVNGRTVANFAAVRSHLKRWERPSLRFTESGSTPRMVLLEAQVDQSGRVTSVARLDGDVEISLQIEKAVRSWEFNPFEYDGRPVAVTARLPFTVTPVGSVISPVFP